MLSAFCTKVPETTSVSEVDFSSYSLASTVSPTLSNLSATDCSPLVLRNSDKSHHCELENSNLLSYLRRLMLGTSTFQFRRFQDAEVDEDAHTVVTYISLGTSTPLPQRHMKDDGVEKNETLAKCLVTRKRRQKSPKKRHVSWKDLEAGSLEKSSVFNRHSMYLPSLDEIKLDNEERARRRHSYTEANNFVYSLPYVPHLPKSTLQPHQNLQKQQQKQQQLPSTAASMVPNDGVNFDERKARYKLQLRHFKHRRRYSDWYFTLYEFDKPENPEESLALDSHLFDTILSRLHGIYALSLNSAFDPKSNSNQNPPARLCFERLPELPAVANINNSSSRRHHRRQRHWDSRFIDNPSSNCLSCISFGMFDSSSPHNPGQLFCPERDLFGGIGSFYCQGCGRNMTGGSSLASVAGSSGSEQRPEFCYSMTRSVEFYRFTRTIQLQRHNERTNESRRRHRTSPNQPNPTSKAPHERICRAPKRSRHRSSREGHHLRESVSVPPSQPLAHSPPRTETASTATPQARNSIREKHKKVRRVMHKRMSQQRVADWLVATHGNQTAACSPPLIVF
ncbi:hypothetical protein Aperf_G00000112761 [Anoplocephala perfoliata]